MRGATGIAPAKVIFAEAPSGWWLNSEESRSLFGSSVATGGDFDGNGRPDLAVGLRGLIRSERRTGGIQLLSFDADWELWSLHAEGMAAGFESLGCAVKILPDVNGDGLPELAGVAIRTPPESALRSGFVLWYGRRAKPLGEPDWRLGAPSTGFARAPAIDSAGDVNGDGFNDLLLGQPRHRGKLQDEGVAAIYLGSESGLGTNAAWTVPGGSAGMRFGYSVCGVGDVNGDGIDDIMAGAPAYNSTASQAGVAFLYLGASNGPATTAAWHHQLSSERAWFGAAIAAAGDLNGDGYDDALVSAPGHFQVRQRNAEWRGRVLCYAGSTNGLASSSAFELEGESHLHAFGQSIVLAGDMDRDGHTEVAVGAPEFVSGGNLKGAVFLYSISRDLKVMARHVLHAERPDDYLGWSLAGGTDLNGDGFPDLVASAGFSGESNERGGRVRIIWGGSNCLARAGSPWKSSEPEAIPDDPIVAAGIEASTAPTGTTSFSGWRTVLWLVLPGGLLGLLVWRRRWQARAQAVTAERSRIARELHDDVGSRLAEIALITGLDKHQPLDVAQLEERIRQIHDVARTTAHSIKELVWDLNHTHATAKDLAGALADYVERMLQLAGVSVRIEMQEDWPEIELPPATRHASFMIVKESVHNLIKHSQATRATLTLGLRQGEFSLRIRDNGLGFDPRLSATSGHGLPGMRQRAKETGGSLECLASPGAGTEIRLSYKIDFSS